MKKILITILLILTLLTTVHAAVEPEEIPAELFEQVDLTDEQLAPVLQPLFDTIQPFLRNLSVLVGGIFGLYLILILARIHYERKKVKLLNDIRYDLDQANKHNDIPYSRMSNGLLRRLWCDIKTKEQTVMEKRKKAKLKKKSKKPKKSKK